MKEHATIQREQQSSPKSLSRRDRPRKQVEFTRREAELLKEWGACNGTQIDDAFETRVLNAVSNAGLLRRERDLDAQLARRAADEDAIAGEMAADAAEGYQEVQASRDAEIRCDVDEFCDIVEQHKPHLTRTALRLSGDSETARDLVQETLARAWASFAQFPPGTNARAWLMTILMRLFYDHLKHARVISNAEPEIRTLEPAACDPVPQQIPDAQLWAAVDALEPGLRGVVERCYVQDMTYKAIAEELKLPIGTIGTRLRRAREQLKLLLDNLLEP